MEVKLKLGKTRVLNMLNNIQTDNKRAIWLLVVLALFVIASNTYIESIYINSSLKDYNRNATYAIKKNSIIGNDTVNAPYLGKEKFSYLFWDECGIKTIGTPNLKATSRAHLIKFNGSINLLLNTNVLFDTSKECVISKDVAYDIFGTTKAKGLTVLLNKKQYKIVDIINLKENIIAINTRFDNTTNYKYVSIRTKKAYDMVNIQDSVANRFALAGKIITFNFSNAILNLFVGIIPFVLFIYLMYEIIKDIKDSSKKDYGFKPDKYSKYNFNYKKVLNVGVRILVLIIMAIVILSLFVKHINLSEDFIPTKWSDFDFWINLYKNKRNELVNLRMFQNLLSVKSYYANYIKVILLSVISWILYLVGIIVFVTKYKHKHSAKQR